MGVKGIDGVSAWVDFTIKDFAKSHNANSAWGADHDGGIDLLLIGWVVSELKESAIDVVRSVEENNDVGEFARTSDVFEKGSLVGVELEIMSVWVIGSDTWEVPAFASDTGEDDKSGVAILAIAVSDFARVFGDRGLTSAQNWGFAVLLVIHAWVTRTGWAGGFFALVEVLEGFVIRETSLFEGIEDALFGFVSARSGRATATIDKVDGVLAEDGDFGVLLKRKSVVLVLEKDHAFFADLSANLFGVVEGIVFGSDAFVWGEGCATFHLLCHSDLATEFGLADDAIIAIGVILVSENVRGDRHCRCH
jgi:hypothetical protein